ncbi:MAG: STAS domain-containing protein [Oscillochloris sp.]|nr:STAS domain-containing protein [Oscillochloris sp.]
MAEQLDKLKPDLEQGVLVALQSQAMSNRGSLPFFRLPFISHELVEALLIGVLQSSQDAYIYGEVLGKLGLSLSSLTAAQNAVIGIVARVGDADQRIPILVAILGFFGQVTQGLVAGEANALERQRADMERIYTTTMAAQTERQEQLLSTIRELSTPIMPVYSGILVLPLVGSIDSRRAGEIAETLLEAIAIQQAEIVIMDITGVPLIDTSTINNLLMTARAASLLGSQVVLVGISPEIAQTMVQLGVDLQNLTTLANLQAGIAYALEQAGLAIQPPISYP